MTATCSPPANPIDADGLRDRVDAALGNFLDEQEERFDDLISDPQSRSQWRAATQSLRGFLAGGKRIRPAFCYWGWRGAGGGADDEGVIGAAAALELLHSFALVHDDIIDASDTRRGAPSLHRQHAELHRRSGGRGSSELFGTSIALLLGDLCLAWFHDMLATSGLPAERIREARPLVAHSLTELVLGQYLDVAEQACSRHSVSRSYTVIHYKTAKYTIERPLHLGGVLAGASPALLGSYTAYAMPLGEAFQLRDDVLGAFGDPAVTGKPVADDLRTRKATVLLATARERASAAQEAEIDRLFTGADLDDAQTTRLQDLVVETGALAECERLIDRRVDAAAAALGAMPVGDDVRAVLASLIRATTDRAR
ncbi:geranylgeranyl diphosphate synthase type I [Saccharopolyspora erythraea NRRL 2338]|uniref:Geranylgeranyl pyrophosphate synthase n=2 Tax=Saccharopolyspora erythraea TaxID=1836 RepID=A4FK77_SACEN|nr:polyprenyl synthetase family protein [Saccharopolyspora erythraea]EQD85264.1 geranylgeranyl pyrophosphate synthase [Saccharopolyspora erythraea D]PFG98090.1 geranylgeranyl diphosphate synthase type I [Saccharopolyspora erythraea NRRL 2338]QRK88200.1 polyprenyl synthetase family protein [Saccharopolyspora erythraea]CAM04452.1 geranylgeranyl pyrophosphate synthase [Saccharopolyspora erythraea NRRL 2338]